MKKIKKIIAAVSICAMAFSIAGCKMIEKTPEAIRNTVYATVGNSKITQGDFEDEYANTLKLYYGVTEDQLKEQYGDDYESNEQIGATIKQIKQTVFQQLVTRLLSDEQTEITVSDDDVTAKVDEEINSLKEQYKDQGDTAFDDALKGIDQTEDSYRALLTKQIKTQLIAEEVTKDITVTDEEVQSYYDENKDSQYTTGAGADAYNILIAVNDSDGNFDDAASLAKANEVKAQIDGGADFATLAKEYNTDSTKDNGGSLGFIAYDSTNYVTEFMDAFKTLKEGEVSAPVKSTYGYHIIKATGLKDATVTPFDEVKETIKSTLLQQKQNEAYQAKLKEWKESLKVNVKADEFKDYDKTTTTDSTTDSSTSNSSN